MHATSTARASAAPRCAASASAASTSARTRAVAALPRTGTFSSARCFAERPRACVVTRAASEDESGEGAKTSLMSKADALLEKVGLSLGPIGMTLGESKPPGTAAASPEAEKADEFETDSSANESLVNKAGKMMDDAGVSLGPIGMTLGGGDASKPSTAAKAAASSSSPGETSASSFVRGSDAASIASMSTKEWRETYVNEDGTVDLFLKDEFNAASRLAGASDAFDSLTNIENVAWNGLPSDAIETKHRVRVTDHETGEVLELDVPEGRYVLFEAEQDGWELPNACRMGCCTKCAVKVTKGTLEQPEALGLSKRYRDEGYALLCVATATSDVECVTQDEEEVYQMQFGELFQQLATDVESGAVVRDDFALEIADMDE